MGRLLSRICVVTSSLDHPVGRLQLVWLSGAPATEHPGCTYGCPLGNHEFPLEFLFVTIFKKMRHDIRFCTKKTRCSLSALTCKTFRYVRFQFLNAGALHPALVVVQVKLGILNFPRTIGHKQILGGYFVVIILFMAELHFGVINTDK